MSINYCIMPMSIMPNLYTLVFVPQLGARNMLKVSCSTRDSSIPHSSNRDLCGTKHKTLYILSSLKIIQDCSVRNTGLLST